MRNHDIISLIYSLIIIMILQNHRIGKKVTKSQYNSTIPPKNQGKAYNTFTIYF